MIFPAAAEVTTYDDVGSVTYVTPNDVEMLALNVNVPDAMINDGMLRLVFPTTENPPQ
jgi:hypothetical protein